MKIKVKAGELLKRGLKRKKRKFDKGYEDDPADSMKEYHESKKMVRLDSGRDYSASSSILFDRCATYIDNYWDFYRRSNE